MSKQFKKGDKVTILSSWDDAGTVYAIQAVVHSCGSKRMLLTSEATGAELGNEYHPEYLPDHCIRWEGRKVVHRLEGSELESAGMALAEYWLKAQRAYLETLRNSPYYTAAWIERVESELHEPRFLIRES